STHFFSRFFFLTTRSPPLFTLFPYTTLFRSVFLLSGLIGGFAGGLQILGVNYRFIDHFSPGYGFTGIAVALLGRGHPAGILLSRSEEHTSELQSRVDLVCRLLLEKKNRFSET